MKNTQNSFTFRASVLAVQGALIALAAMPSAYAQTSTDLTNPTNTIELGVASADKNSYKFGEYNGMQKSGAYLLGGFDVKGGGTYDTDNATRFRITGSDLGLDTRKLGAEFGEQGKFRFTFGYDEIVKNRSDSYMTPYNGAGTNTQTLPSNWATNQRNCTVRGFGAAVGVAGTAGCGNYFVTQSTAAGVPTATATGDALRLNQQEQNDFQHFNLATQRKKMDFGFGYIFNPQWQMSASAKHETKDGAQAIGQAIGSATASQVTLANPIKYTTNQFDAKIEWKGQKAFVQGSYYASVFQNGIQSVTYQDPYFSSGVPNVLGTVTAASATTGAGAIGAVNFPFPDNGRFSSAPNNQFQQLKLAGGYDITKAYKLVGDVAYGRNTQNQDFQPYATGYWQNVPMPANSLNGLVVQKSLNLKLTGKPIKNLKVGAAYKYDDRDDQTTGTTGWKFTEADLQTPFNPGTLPTVGRANVAGGVAALRPSGTGVIITQPYHKKVTQWDLDADYSFRPGQAVKGGYQYQSLDRHCSATLFDCANVQVTKEDSWRAEYRNNMLENVTGRISLVDSNRKAGNYTNSPYLGAGLASDTLTRFMFTDRKRDKWRASVNWQATDQLDFTVGYDYTDDRFTLGKNPGGVPTNQAIGLQNAKSDALNLDVGYRVSEMVSVNAFYSTENMRSLLVANINPANATGFNDPSWTADQKDKVETYGIGAKAFNVASRWNLGGDYIRVHATSPYALTAGAGAVSTNAAYNGIAGTFANFPSTFSTTDTLRFNATYSIDKKSAFRINYAYTKLSSADPLTYNGLQMGTPNNALAGSATAAANGVAVPAGSVMPISSLMPTNEQAPNYKVQVIGVTYIYSFQ